MMPAPNFFDHTSLGLGLAVVVILAVDAWALWVIWKVTR